MLSSIIQWFVETVHSPKRVALFCGFFLFCNLIVDGTLYKIWQLHRGHTLLQKQIFQVNAAIRDLDSQILQAKDPQFIQRQALDRLDLAEENDLVFYFSE